MNMLERAANVLHDKLEKHASTEVTYIREGVGEVTVRAIVGETQFSQDNQSGVIDRIIQRDYIIRQSLLVINGRQIKPMRQDIILQRVGDLVYESRVLGEAGLPHYQESDGFGVAWRIHTKRDEVLGRAS